LLALTFGQSRRLAPSFGEILQALDRLTRFASSRAILNSLLSHPKKVATVIEEAASTIAATAEQPETR
jgi:hypothetical protein